MQPYESRYQSKIWIKECDWLFLFKVICFLLLLFLLIFNFNPGLCSLQRKLLLLLFTSLTIHVVFFGLTFTGKFSDWFYLLHFFFWVANSTFTWTYARVNNFFLCLYAEMMNRFFGKLIWIGWTIFSLVSLTILNLKMPITFSSWIRSTRIKELAMVTGIRKHFI